MGKAFNQNSLMQLFNGDRRIVQCFPTVSRPLPPVQNKAPQPQLTLMKVLLGRKQCGCGGKKFVLWTPNGADFWVQT